MFACNAIGVTAIVATGFRRCFKFSQTFDLTTQCVGDGMYYRNTRIQVLLLRANDLRFAARLVP